ncbi:RHS repeat-associated core domain-containing protein [Acanthopleuribacter pedis]|uniref:Uncharacterized protein n=1 Tax=Acanthopleuribacter pedis TaxID=442870 RepID=A0A8J7U5P3_9BACT|nr:RHS repeat-associated core domain-containing protein [Acanthopleuribacter pedis]MBO1322773.1 hypothetical protein [Acanthopleuribacter pedis]
MCCKLIHAGFIGLLLFFYGLIPSATACDREGCDQLSAGQLRAELARWGSDSRDCNGDESADIVDLVCLLNQTPNLTPPDVAMLEDRLLTVGETLAFTVDAEDFDGDSLSFFAPALPANAAFDSSSGLFSFAPDETQAGTYRFVLFVDDGLFRIRRDMAVTVRNETLCNDAGFLTVSPAHGDRGVAVTRETILRFPQPLAPAVSPDDLAISVQVGDSSRPFTRRLAKNRRTLTLFYAAPLPERARVQLDLTADAFVLENGCLLDADGDGLPGGTARISFDTLSLAVVEGTAVCGRVFASRPADAGVNEPLEGVTITVDGLENQLFARTDANGDFRLEPAPAGEFFVHIDGRTAVNPAEGGYYPFVGKTWTAIPLEETNIGEVYLPLIAADTLQPVSETSTTVVNFPAAVLAENPEWEGVRLLVPPGALFADDGSQGGQVGIAPVDPDRIPGALPDGLDFGLVVTVQTDGATNFDEPAAICLPNLPDSNSGQRLPPGAKTALWSFNHDRGRWEIVGSMTVSADGLLVCTDEGVGIRAPGWHGVNPASQGGGGAPDAPEAPPYEKGTGSSPPAQPNNRPSNPDCDKNPNQPNSGDNPTDPVYLFSGEYYEEIEDWRIPGRGLDFVWSRKYRSQRGPNTAQGNGWDFSYHVFLEQSGSALLMCDGNSRRDRYFPLPGRPNTWGRREFFRTLQYDPETDQYTLTFEDRGRWVFFGFAAGAASGKLAFSIDRNGNQLAFSYDGSGRLTRVTDTLDRIITLSYNPRGLIEAVTDFAGRALRFAYYDGVEPGGNAGDLKSVTTPAVVGTPNGNDFPAGKTTVYTYATGFADERLNHNLLTVTDGKGQTWLVNEYSSETNPRHFLFDRVVRQRWGDRDDIIDLSYVPLTASPENDGAVVKTIVNDRVGNVKEYFYDLGNRCVRHRDYTGRAVPNLPTTETENRPAGKLRPGDPAFFETRLEWTDDSLLKRRTFPNGNITEYVYESDLNPAAPVRSRANLRIIRRLPGSHTPPGDQAVIEEHFTYSDAFGCGTCFNFVTHHVDGRGNETVHQYDSAGNRTRTTHRLGTIVEDFDYNAFGQLTEHHHPDNGNGSRRRDVFRYHESGHQRGYLHEHVVDADGTALTTAYEYDTVGNVVREVDPRGFDTHYVVNQRDQVVRRLSRPIAPGSEVRYEIDYFYDANDNLVQVDVANRDETGSPAENARLTQTTTYDILNMPLVTTREVDATRNLVTEKRYDRNRNLVLTRNGEATNGNQPGNEVRYEYDERDLLFREVRAPQRTVQATTQTDYDGNGNPVVRRVGLEAPTPRVTVFAYDGFNRLVTATDAMGNVRRLFYDANGNPTRAVTEGELEDGVGDTNNLRLAEETLNYDAMDRLERRERAFFDAATQAPLSDGIQTQAWRYSDVSQLLHFTDDNQRVTAFQYDSANRPDFKTDAAGNTLDYRYDANSNVVTVVESEVSDLDNPAQSFTTHISYDPLDRPATITDSAGNLTRTFYDSRHNTVRSVDPLGNQRHYRYDGLNRLVREEWVLTEDGTGNSEEVGRIVLEQVWDDSSRLVQRIDGNGNITESRFDALDRETTTRFADLTETGRRYDVFGNVVNETDAVGNSVTYRYDRLNRVTAADVVVGDGAVADTTFERFRYDGLGRVIRAEDDDALVTFTYDSLSNRTSETLNGQTTQAEHDGEGNMVRCVYPGGRIIETDYDSLNRKATIRDSQGTLADYHYFGPNRVERRDLGNGTRLDVGYNGIDGIANVPGDFGAKQIVRTTHARISDSSLLDDRAYRWDGRNNKRGQVDLVNGINQSYQYDSIYRLQRSQRTQTGMDDAVVTYAYDAVGNRTSVSGGPDPGVYTRDATTPEPADAQQNQYTQTPLGTHQYDRNGNLIQTVGTDNLTRVYGYDYRNRLVRYSDATQTARYGYDPFGRRFSKTVDTGTTGITFFAYSGWQVVEEQDVTQETSATYVYGNYIDEILNMNRNGQRYWYHSDDLYHVRSISDHTGILTERYKYRDFGEVLILDNADQILAASMVGNPYDFTGRRSDSSTGLTYYRKRYYHPKTGQFTSRDPIGPWVDRANLGHARSYLHNNPLNGLDPTGEYKVQMGVVGAIGAAFQAVVGAVSGAIYNVGYSPYKEGIPYGPSVRETYGDAYWQLLGNYGGPKIVKLDTVSKWFEDSLGDTRWLRCMRRCLRDSFDSCNGEYTDGFYAQHGFCATSCL